VDALLVGLACPALAGAGSFSEDVSGRTEAQNMPERVRGTAPGEPCRPLTMMEQPCHNDPERYIDDRALGLSFRVCGYAPVQADGRVRGAPFYFRSRHAAWTFTVCISHDIDASAIDAPEDKSGFVQIGEYRAYYISGDYGKGDEASFMRYDEAERIIRECVRQYVRAAAEVA